MKHDSDVCEACIYLHTRIRTVLTHCLKKSKKAQQEQSSWTTPDVVCADLERGLVQDTNLTKICNIHCAIAFPLD